MTTRLYLLRHGIALPHGTPGVEEDDRPLTTKGESHLEQVADGLRCLGVEADRVVTSPLPRARKTAEIVAAVLGWDDRLENADALRPGASARSIHGWLMTRSEDRLMLVGHNPSLTDLLALLIGLPEGNTPFELKKGGTAELRADDPGSYRLRWLATPRIFRRLQD